MIIFEIIFWLSIFLIFHTYVLYPVLLKILASRKKFNFQNNTEEFPSVSILMSCFNEETVIAQKIESIIDSDYPQEKIQIIIGSDNSSDNTNNIISSYAEKYSNIIFKPFNVRQGKSNIINQLYDISTGEILILTDANVFFDKNTIKEIVKPFQIPEIGLVDSNMINTGIKLEGISFQEKSYISREVIIKHRESLLWGTMMGPFGGCFAIRRNLYSPVPKNFLVDDFYICMKVLEMKYKAINSLEAKVFEDVSNNLSIEFKRKIRIATGDFQNLNRFKKLLFPPWKGLAFSFLSHKVLRWITPIFMIFAWISAFIMSFSSDFYLILFIAYNFIFFLTLADFLLKKLNIHNVILRFITHFLTMNLALLIGMFKSIKGVESNVWKPTKRNQ
jgi:cellulose synthase/poly-beta-1,6-N-acetylglucosamine synthase-like glycosyltransferase